MLYPSMLRTSGDWFADFDQLQDRIALLESDLYDALQDGPLAREVGLGEDALRMRRLGVGVATRAATRYLA